MTTAWPGTFAQAAAACAVRRSSAQARDTLRARIQRRIDATVEIFETDRLLYDVEVEAMTAWIRRLVAFDAYCARRDSRLR